MEIFLKKLDNILKTIDKNEEISLKIDFYIEKIKQAIKSREYNELIEIENNLHKERKNIRITLSRNFPLFVKYDNIYLEMIRIVRHFLKKESI